MAKDSKRQCPDCDTSVAMFAWNQGDGKCRECNGTGDYRDPVDVVTLAVSFGTVHLDRKCTKCAGTGQCITCGGTGYQYYDWEDGDSTDAYDMEGVADESDHPQHYDSPEGYSSDVDYSYTVPTTKRPATKLEKTLPAVISVLVVIIAGAISFSRGYSFLQGVFFIGMWFLVLAIIVIFIMWLIDY